MSESWVEKHRPETFGEIQGNNTDIDELKKWAENFTPGDRGQLLVGPPGVGKTTTAHVIANEMGYPLLEVNASDSRGSKGIQEIADDIQSRPAEAEYRVMLIDEVDSQHHATTKKPLYNALDSPQNLVLLTANDEYDTPNAIRNRTKVRNFSLRKSSRRSKLKDIVEAEGLEIEEEDLEALAERPDLRSAIQDLQVWAEQDIPPGQDNREWELDWFDVVDNVLRGKKETGDKSPDDLLMWLDENLSREFRGVEVAVAYDTLSRADKWLDRGRRDEWRYWKYASELLDQVATQRITEPYSGWMDKDFPEWFRHSTPNATSDDDSEAILYRALSEYKEPTFRLGGDFVYFRKWILPILKDLDTEEKLQMAHSNRVPKQGIKALGLTKKQYESWANQEVPEERQQDEDDLLQQDALSW